jgi:protocatechuate 3,4-dioxygenase beta subunit
VHLVSVLLLVSGLAFARSSKGRCGEQGGGPAREQQAAVPKEHLGELKGRVLRADTGEPLNKAIVTLIPAAQPTQGVSVRTDAAGRYQFVEVVPGTYRLRAQRSGFVAQVYGQRGGSSGSSITLSSGQRLDKIDFRLDRAGVISGAILDEDSEPVEGLLVHAVRMRFRRGGKVETNVLRTTRTDDVGEYRLAGLAPGFYLVQAGGRGDTVSINLQAPPVSYGPVFYPNATDRDDASRVKVTAGSVVRGIDIRVRSAETYSISGVVVDGSAPSSSKQVSVGFAFGGGGTATAPARRDGSFAFHGMPPGQHTLVASVSDESGIPRRGYAIVNIVDSDVRVAIVVGRTAEVGGQSRMEDGQPFSFDGIRIELAAENPEAVSVSTMMEEGGSFQVKNVPGGSYLLRVTGKEEEAYLKHAQCKGEDFSAKPIVVEAEEKVDDCVLTFSRELSVVRGRVSQGQEPAEQVVVVLIPRELERRRNPRHTIMTQTDESGRFEIKGVIPGDYFAFAVPPSDDAVYYDLGFADRNREKAERLTVKPREVHSLELKVTDAR